MAASFNHLRRVKCDCLMPSVLWWPYSSRQQLQLTIKAANRKWKRLVLRSRRTSTNRTALELAGCSQTTAVLVNATGPHTDITQYYDRVFKTGVNHLESTVTQATTLGPDTMIAIGEFVSSGKDASGAAVGGSG